MSSIDNPTSLLVDVSGSLMAVTASLNIPSGQTGILVAGVGSDGKVRYPQINSDASLKVSGAMSASVSGPVASGSLFSTNPQNPVLIAGIDYSGSVRIPLLNKDGATYVSNFEENTFYLCLTGSTFFQNANIFHISLDVSSGYYLKIYGIWVVNVQTDAVDSGVAEFELRRLSNSQMSFPGKWLAVDLTPMDIRRPLFNTGSFNAYAGASISTPEKGPLIYRSKWSASEWGPSSINFQSFERCAQSMLPPTFSVHSKLNPLIVTSDLQPLSNLDNATGARIYTGFGGIVLRYVSSVPANFDVHILLAQVPTP